MLNTTSIFKVAPLILAAAAGLPTLSDMMKPKFCDESTQECVSDRVSILLDAVNEVDVASDGVNDIHEYKLEKELFDALSLVYNNFGPQQRSEIISYLITRMPRSEDLLNLLDDDLAAQKIRDYVTIVRRTNRRAGNAKIHTKPTGEIDFASAKDERRLGLGSLTIYDRVQVHLKSPKTLKALRYTRPLIVEAWRLNHDTDIAPAGHFVYEDRYGRLHRVVVHSGDKIMPISHTLSAKTNVDEVSS